MNLNKYEVQKIFQGKLYRQLTLNQKVIINQILESNSSISVLSIPGSGLTHLLEFLYKLLDATFQHGYNIIRPNSSKLEMFYNLLVIENLFAYDQLQDIFYSAQSNIIFTGFTSTGITKMISKYKIPTFSLVQNFNFRSEQLFSFFLKIGFSNAIQYRSIPLNFIQKQQHLENNIQDDIIKIIQTRVNFQDKRDYFRNKDAVFKHKTNFAQRLENFHKFICIQKQQIQQKQPLIFITDSSQEAISYHLKIAENIEKVVKVRDQIFWDNALIIFNQNYLQIKCSELAIITGIKKLNNIYHFVILQLSTNILFQFTNHLEYDTIPFELAFALSIDRWYFLKLRRIFIKIQSDTTRSFILQCFSISDNISIILDEENQGCNFQPQTISKVYHVDSYLTFNSTNKNLLSPQTLKADVLPQPSKSYQINQYQQLLNETRLLNSQHKKCVVVPNVIPMIVQDTRQNFSPVGDSYLNQTEISIHSSKSDFQ